MIYESLSEEEKLWPTMADESVVFQLDVLFVSLAVLTLVHAVKTKGIWTGSAVVVFMGLHTALFEHISLFLGGTHCHATSPVLPKVTPCSSVNSLLFYIPWIYTSIEAATKLQLGSLAFPFAVGLLQFGFGTVYEMQGPINNFWHWPEDSGMIADSVLLQPFDGYPPLDFLKDAQEQKEVATIIDGVFSVSRHAQQALEERLFGFPVLAPYFHFAYGFAWAMGLVLFGNIAAKKGCSLFSIVISGLQSTIFFVAPIEITRQLTHALGLPYLLGVPLSLGLSSVPIYESLKHKKSAAESSSSKSGAPDWLLFSISVLMHAFMVSFHLRAPTPTPQGLVVLVTVIATVHLTAQYYCCIKI